MEIINAELNSKLQKISLVVLRVGIGAVIVWFGSQQLMDPAPWTSYLPDFTKILPISQITFIYLNGWFEITFGALMILGFYTRIVALFLALHMFGIVVSVGYNATGIRDVGIATALASIALYGESAWSLDKFFTKRSNASLNGNSR
ncbi:MAG: DoxX family protein [bacterium]